MKRSLLLLLLVAGCSYAPYKADAQAPDRNVSNDSPSAAATQPAHWKLAPTPPMGWNSWDCWGTELDEAKALANADVMAERLRPFGYDVFTVDIQWYEAKSKGTQYTRDPDPALDEHGRLMPTPAKWPSGFGRLKKHLDAHGLKFGIHLMRGIPRKAVELNTPILNGNGLRARDIADTRDTCDWNPDMYGVDPAKPGAQAYYDSVIARLAEWGVDYVKIDDLSRPYHEQEIELIRNALDKCGRPIVFSTSPGVTPLSAGPHVERHANLWRISDDFWDIWKPLKDQFQRLHDWSPHRGYGRWPDADMLPFGAIRAFDPPAMGTRFTPDEQRTCMTLWCIARSPLIAGGDLTKSDEASFALLTNRAVLDVNQKGEEPRQVSRDGDKVVWTSKVPGSRDVYVALFNLGDEPAEVRAKLDALGVGAAARATDLWTGADIGNVDGEVKATLAPHASVLYRLAPQ